MILTQFYKHFGDRAIPSFNTDEILSSLSKVTSRNKQSTKKLRFSLLTAFFNFIRSRNRLFQSKELLYNIWVVMKKAGLVALPFVMLPEMSLFSPMQFPLYGLVEDARSSRCTHTREAIYSMPPQTSFF